MTPSDLLPFPSPLYSTGLTQLDNLLGGGLPGEGLITVHGDVDIGAAVGTMIHASLLRQGVVCERTTHLYPQSANRLAHDLHHRAIQERKVIILTVGIPRSTFCPPECRSASMVTILAETSGLSLTKYREPEGDPRIRFVTSLLRRVPDFPRPGINFCDITTVLANPHGLRMATQLHIEAAQRFQPFTKVVGIESRGFLFGQAVAAALHAGFVPARKPGKLPAPTTSQAYSLEYGSNEIHIHNDAISEGDRVLVTDDLLATGGTADAACQLVTRLGGTVAGSLFMIELTDLRGRLKLLSHGPVAALITEGEEREVMCPRLLEPCPHGGRYDGASCLDQCTEETDCLCGFDEVRGNYP